MLAKAVEENLDAWAEAEGGRAHLVNLSENHTFRIDRDDGRHFILRVHRPGYQSSDAIESELSWIRALRRDAGLPVPVPLAGKDGRLLQHLSLGLDEPRAAVLFRFEAGREPRESEKLEPLFMRLGEIAAHLHRHAETFVPPAGFARPKWDAAAVLDADGLWGDWRKAPKLTGEGRAILTALGVDETVPSPTFTLVQTYETPRFPVSHYDLYRLKRSSELEELGLEEALDDGAALIEWPERAEGHLPPDALSVHLLADHERHATMTGPARWRSLETAHV